MIAWIVGHPWLLAWLGVLSLAVLLEVLAIVHKGPADTLSWHIWRLYEVPGWGPFSRWMISALLGWAMVHFATNGKWA